MKIDTQTLQVEITLAPAEGRKGGQRSSASGSKVPDPARIPRITRLMALAIKFEAMVERGEVRDYADLARLGYVSRARVTQIMNLALLAPGLQEELLFATEGTGMTERLLRQIITVVDWDEQRRRWQGLDTRNQKPIISPESGTRRATKMP